MKYCLLLLLAISFFSCKQEKPEKQTNIYQRNKENNTVIVVINFSDKDQFFTWPFEKDSTYKLEMGSILPDDSGMGLGANDYAVWVK